MAKKTDNHNLAAKLALRRYFLQTFHKDGDIRVLDCCQAAGIIWGTLRTEFALSSYWGVDLKPKPGRLKIDSVRILQQPGLEIAGKLLKAAGIYYEEIQSVFRGFVARKMKDKDTRAYAMRVIAGDDAKEDDLAPVTVKAINRMVDLAETGEGSRIKGVRGSLWGAYNGVTQYVDHERTKSIGYIEHGRGSELKQRAFNVAQALIIGNN